LPSLLPPPALADPPSALTARTSSPPPPRKALPAARRPDLASAAAAARFVAGYGARTTRDSCCCRRSCSIRLLRLSPSSPARRRTRVAMASQRRRAGDGRSESGDEGQGEGERVSGVGGESWGAGMGRAQGEIGARGGDARERATRDVTGEGRGVREEGSVRGGRQAAWGAAGLETVAARECLVLACVTAWVAARAVLRGALPPATVASMVGVWAAGIGTEWSGMGRSFRVMRPRLGASSPGLPGLHLALITPSAAIAAVCCLHRAAPLSTPPRPLPGCCCCCTHPWRLHWLLWPAL
ncbi:hypothetical protein CLOM_g21024, partial [Closterium sp. NIES-68]